MSRKTTIVIIVIAIIFLSIGTGGTYIYYQNEINNLNNEIKNLNDQLSGLNYNETDNLEFDRYLARSFNKIMNSKTNEGLAEAYKEQADNYYDLEEYHLSEKYYSYAQNHYGYARDNFSSAVSYLKQAKTYSTNDKTFTYINMYIGYTNISKEWNILGYKICNSLSIVSQYYNVSNWNQGDEELNKTKDNIDEYNYLIQVLNDILDDINVYLQSSWIT
jgi:hypothetical protein